MKLSDRGLAYTTDSTIISLAGVHRCSGERAKKLSAAPSALLAFRIISLIKV